MGLMVTFGNELIRFNPSNNRIEYSTNRGTSWFTRNSGNTQGIYPLVKGMRVDDAIARLEGIRCGGKATSCPDQLARVLKTASMSNEMMEQE